MNKKKQLEKWEKLLPRYHHKYDAEAKLMKELEL